MFANASPPGCHSERSEEPCIHYRKLTHDFDVICLQMINEIQGPSEASE